VSRRLAYIILCRRALREAVRDSWDRDLAPFGTGDVSVNRADGQSLAESRTSDQRRDNDIRVVPTVFTDSQKDMWVILGADPMKIGG
jgi:hypothetical protein